MLIIYYSASGTTAKIARRLQTKTSAKLVKMQISPAYPANYMELAAVSKQQIDNEFHPDIVNLPDLSTENTIFIGFPTWYHQPPMFVNSFFEQNDLRGKVIVPFSTSMIDPMSLNEPFLKKMAQNSGAILQDGFSNSNKKQMETYLKDHTLLE